MPMAYRAKVGMNVGRDDRRYEPGDVVPDEYVEAYMTDEGLVDAAPAPRAPRVSRGPVASTGGSDGADT